MTVETLQFLVVAIDIGLVALSALLARLFYSDDTLGWSDAIAAMAGIEMLASAVFIGFLFVRRAYSVAHLSDMRRQAVAVLQGWAMVFFTLGWLAFLLKVTAHFSRGTVTLQFLIGLLLLLAFHVVGARWLARRFAEGSMSIRRVAAIMVADDNGVERIRSRLTRKGVEVVGLSTIAPSRLGHHGFLSACREAVCDVRTALATNKLDGIYLFVSWRDRRRIEELKAALTPMPVPIYLFADREVESLMVRPRVRIGELVGFELQRAPLSRDERMMKRALDIAVAGSALVLLSPLMALTSLAILFETGFPVFFRQNRKGFGARPFEILKFRSMTVQENGSVVKQATRGDARITRLGAILRKTSIDELPQLINVLKGDMSIVGPRPHAIAHDDHYDQLIAAYAFRQHVKPGITGWAQVNGLRGETRELGQMADRVEYDLWYINNWSVWLDIKIIVMTAVKVLTDKTAF